MIPRKSSAGRALFEAECTCAHPHYASRRAELTLQKGSRSRLRRRKPIPSAGGILQYGGERMRTLCMVLTLAMVPSGYAQLIGSRSIVNAASFMAPGDRQSVV